MVVIKLKQDKKDSTEKERNFAYIERVSSNSVLLKDKYTSEKIKLEVDKEIIEHFKNKEW